MDVFVNLVLLLRSLCGTSPTALQIFNQSGILASLLHATDIKVFSQSVVVAVCKQGYLFSALLLNAVDVAAAMP